jgi:hypothetical protein
MRSGGSPHTLQSQGGVRQKILSPGRGSAAVSLGVPDEWRPMPVDYADTLLDFDESLACVFIGE